MRCCAFPRGQCTIRCVGPTTTHVDNKGINDGLCKGEMQCSGPKPKDADLWISTGEEVRRIHRERTLLELEHVDRSKKEKQELSLFDVFHMEGNEKRMSWQQMEQCWVEARWLRQGAAEFNKRQEEFTRHCSTLPAYTVWSMSGWTVKNLSRSRNNSGMFTNSWRLRRIARNCVRPQLDTVA